MAGRASSWRRRLTDTPAQAHSLRDAAKIYEIARRAGNLSSLEDRHALDHAIEIGRGGTWLELNEEQYQKLKRA